MAGIGGGLGAGQGDKLADISDFEAFKAAAEKAIFAGILATCNTLGIRFDVFTNELDLVRDGHVEAVLKGLSEKGLTTEREGAVWLRGDRLGVPDDRVLGRSGGAPAPVFRAPDIAH